MPSQNTTEAAKALRNVAIFAAVKVGILVAISKAAQRSLK